MEASKDPLVVWARQLEPSYRELRKWHEEQIEAVAGDLRPAASKTGMLASATIVNAVAAAVRRHALAPLVVDPVMVSASGDALLEGDAVAAMRELLIPLATLVTPGPRTGTGSRRGAARSTRTP